MKDNSIGQPDSAGRRAAAYWFSDGLPEVVFGLGLLILGGLGIAWSLRIAGAWTKAAAVAAAFGFLLLFLYDRSVLDFLKARLTYPRTGYVRPPENPEPPSAEIISIANPKHHDGNVTIFRQSTVYVFFLVMLWSYNSHGHWKLPVWMTLAALMVYLLNRQEARPYSWWSVLPIAAAGWATLWLNVPARSQQFLPLLIGGAWLLLRGTWTLAHYLRAHPRPTAMEPAAHE